MLTEMLKMWTLGLSKNKPHDYAAWAQSNVSVKKEHFFFSTLPSRAQA